MTHAAAAAAPDATTDPRIDPQVRSFLAKINKESNSFWELPQPQQILTALKSRPPSICPVDAAALTFARF